MKIPNRRSATLPVAVSCAALLSACAVVELSGTMTRKTGEVMTEYSKENDGVIGKLAGFGGRVNTAVGTTVESAAQKGKAGESTKPKTEQLVDTQRSVFDAAVNAAKPGEPPADAKSRESQTGRGEHATLSSTQPMSIAEAQRRLTELGYQPGPADGAMGKRTSDALVKFQRENNLQVTGKLDSATTDALRKARRPS